MAILHKESVELPSDIAGLIYIPYKERVGEVAAKLFQELVEAGYETEPRGALALRQSLTAEELSPLIELWAEMTSTLKCYIAAAARATRR